jgi:AcrR family transcriptional regulator
MVSRTLSTAEARRIDVLSAAMHIFARGGYWGANTTEIAHAAGISQAYLYRLFANKEDLFVAVIGEVHAWLQQEIGRALSGAPEGGELEALLASKSDPGASEDRDAGMVLLHAAAASSIEPIGAAVRQCYRDQVDYLSSRGLGIADIRAYFAWSQYANTLSAAGIAPGTAHADLDGLIPPPY